MYFFDINESEKFVEYYQAFSYQVQYSFYHFSWIYYLHLEYMPLKKSCTVFVSYRAIFHTIFHN